MQHSQIRRPGIIRRRRDNLRAASTPNRAAIFERLEVTKKYGLLSDYLVNWSGRPGEHSAMVTVWGKVGTPSDLVQHYVTRLLRGLVPDRQITVGE